MWLQKIELVKLDRLTLDDKCNDRLMQLMSFLPEIWNREYILEDKEKLLAFLRAEYGICYFYQYWDSLEVMRKAVMKNYGLIILRKLFAKKVEQKQPVNLIPTKQNNQEIFNARPIIRLMLLTARFNSPLYNNRELCHD